MLTAREEEVGGAETHEMDILGPHTDSVASSLRSVSTGQDINDALAEGVTLSALAVPSRDDCLFYYRIREKRRP